MKISIRRKAFETNSSSMHSLIITNERNKDEDYKRRENDIENYGLYYSNTPIMDKENKIYFLCSLFDYDKDYDNSLKREYEIFLRVLKDNNENELLSSFNTKKEKCKEYDCRVCSNYFENDVLIDCTCRFDKEFKDYFGNCNDDELYNKLYDFIYGDGVIIPYEYM